MTGNGRTVAAAVIAMGLSGTAAFGQPPRPAPADPFAESKARMQIAEQKATADVANAVREADRVARTNPARAAQVLKGALRDVENAISLSNDTKRSLTTQLQTKIAVVEGRPAPAQQPAVASKPDRAGKDDEGAAEVAEVRKGVEMVAYYRSKGDFTSADRITADLAKNYPNNPAVITLTRKDNARNAAAEAVALSQMQGEAWRKSMNSVMASAIPPAGDIEYPTDWKEKSQRRLEARRIKLTPKEQKLIEALDKPLSVVFNERPLDEALQDLSTRMDQSILIDTKSLNDLGIDLRRTVKMDASGVSARTVLRQVLGTAGLTFVVKDESIQVVTAERARDMLVTRVYYLGDVVQMVGPFGGAPRWGPFLDYQQTMANVKVIMDSIQSSIDPLSWQGKNGPGSITFHYPSMSIIVRASAEVHYALGTKMGR
jgi:hypothetical protein